MKIFNHFYTLSLSIALISPIPAFADRTSEEATKKIPEINWQPCYTTENPNLLCAQYPVPLNYKSIKKDAKTIQIALIKLPANNPATKRLGSLFLNPGGPGGSGVQFVRNVGQYLYTQDIRDQYDLIGFDPRGINLSEPITCGLTEEDAKQIIPAFYFPISAQEEKQKIESDKILSSLCKKNANDILDYMATANVARDLDLLRQAVGDELLNYAGYSYGSYIGVTYANLFPQKVGRLVIDGVIDPIAWSTGEHWSGWIMPVTTRLQSDKNSMATLNEFFRLCDLAGPAGCSLAGNSAARFDQVAQSLKIKPLPVFLPDGTTLEITYPLLISSTLNALYHSPSWPELANLVAFIEWQSSPALIGQQYSLLTQELGIDTVSTPADNAVFRFPAVLCSDSDNPLQEEFWPLWAAESEKQNGYFSRLWTWHSSICAHWPGSKKSRFIGPFNKKTKNPVLIASTEFDPATPYSGAKTVARLLPNSRLVTVTGWGHTTPGLSYCADKITVDYLLTGALPTTDTICQQDTIPFYVPESAARFNEEVPTAKSIPGIESPDQESNNQVRKEIIRSNIRLFN